MLFFSDYDIKRIIVSENLLIDCAFSYPNGYKQTLIIMYLDVIELKMVPGIFCCTNNKTYDGYKYIFNDILEKLLGYANNKHAKLKLKTFTTDLELALYTAFNDVFSKEIKDLKHIGCYYHYIFNIINHLNSLGLRKTIKKEPHKKNNDSLNKTKDYFILLNFTRDLPFIPNINKIIKTKINKFKTKYKKNKVYLDFINYCVKQWLLYFERSDLNLNNIHIKIRTNNSLENYYNNFQNNFNKKGKQEAFIFLDVIMEEVINHEKTLCELNSKSFKELSKKK